MICPREILTSLPHSNYDLSSSKQDWLPWSLLLLSLTYDTRAFYVPGVAPINFHQNDPVEIKVGALLDCWSLLCWAAWLEDPGEMVLSIPCLQRTKASASHRGKKWVCSLLGGWKGSALGEPTVPGALPPQLSLPLCSFACVRVFSLCIPLFLFSSGSGSVLVLSMSVFLTLTLTCVSVSRCVCLCVCLSLSACLPVSLAPSSSLFPASVHMTQIVCAYTVYYGLCVFTCSLCHRLDSLIRVFQTASCLSDGGIGDDFK